MYKIIHEGQVIDVVRNPDFLKFLPYGHVVRTNKAYAHGIVGSDKKTIYSFSPQVDSNLKVVTIESITDKEFNRLYSLLNSESKADSFEQELITAKETKIKMLSDICKTKITNGFTVTLKDHNKYSFKLTAEDQFNLLSIENQLRTGAETFIYHATDLPCRVFVRDDMKKIISAYKKHVLYHTTYFNSAKQYINSLKDIDKIKAFTYGVDITYTISDPVIRKIISSGGVY